MNDVFANLFELGFGKPRNFYFNTNLLKDQMPAYWHKTDYGYKCRAKTLGVKSVEVTVEDIGIKVVGESEIDGLKYNTSFELPIAEDVLDNVSKINHYTDAGITIIELYVDRPAKRKILINGN